MDDIEAIKQLKARYFRTLDAKDWAAFRELFTDDFVSDTTASGGKVVVDADGFVAFVRKSLGSRPTVHQGHTPEIELLSPEAARGIWAMEDVVRFLGFVDLHGYGHYHETYEKTGGEWRIKSSRLTRLRMDLETFIVSMKIPSFLIRRLPGAGRERGREGGRS